MENFQTAFSHEPLVLFGLIVVIGFYFGGIARKVRLPSLLGFMLLGVLLGPSLLGFFNESNQHHFDFITEMALGFVAFGIGSELSMSDLKRLGRGIISIILAESFIAFFLVMAAVYFLSGSWPLAILFGALAPASAPAGTVAVIQENNAKGKLTKCLYAVVGFDDGLAILIFGFSAAIAKMLLLNTLGVDGSNQTFLQALKAPVTEIFASILVGIILGFIFCVLVRRTDSSRDKLILTFGFVLLATGVSEIFHLSLILANMLIGFVLVNSRRASFVHKVTTPLNEIMPLIFLLFFCLAGSHLNLTQLSNIGFLGLVYAIARSGGLIGGAAVGGTIGRMDAKIKKWIGFGILSQAGVAIGLSLIVQNEFRSLAARPEVAEAVEKLAESSPDLSRFKYDHLFISGALITTITATCIIFEIIGPILTKLALTKAGEINQKSP